MKNQKILFALLYVGGALIAIAGAFLQYFHVMKNAPALSLLGIIILLLASDMQIKSLKRRIKELESGKNKNQRQQD